LDCSNNQQQNGRAACAGFAPTTRTGKARLSRQTLDNSVDNPSQALYGVFKSLIYKEAAWTAAKQGEWIAQRCPPRLCTA
jgi:hypothetical protein